MFGSVFFSFLNPFFFLRYARPRMLCPTLNVASIGEISIEQLKEKGVTALVFDVDNTLCEHYGKGLDERLQDKVNELSAAFGCVILSNTPSAGRVRELKENFPLPVVETDTRKPKKMAFKAALALTKTNPGHTAMVGDRLLTDIAGANAMGMLSIKVEPLAPESEPFGLSMARRAENMLLSMYRILGLV